MLGEVSLTVDGHPVALAPELGDSLLRALRDAGGTQVTGACEQGECGSCSVVLDGRLVASCLVAAVVCDGADVRTAPGLLGDDLAEALARHGAVQCGFCTPGIVVAAEATIAAALEAGRELPAAAVREALAGNLCRCTGYEGIVAAVVEVAGGAIGRRVVTTLDAAPTVPAPGADVGLVGRSVARPDVPAKIDGSFEFSNDVVVPGMLFGATVRSPHAHARITGIDTGPALALPNVVAAYTVDDVPGARWVGHIVDDQPVLADGVVRYQGEPVAFVVATSQQQAWRAAEAVVVGYEVLEALTDPELALVDGAPAIHPAGNLFRRLVLRHGDPGEAGARRGHRHVGDRSPGPGVPRARERGGRARRRRRGHPPRRHPGPPPRPPAGRHRPRAARTAGAHPPLRRGRRLRGSGGHDLPGPPGHGGP